MFSDQLKLSSCVEPRLEPSRKVSRADSRDKVTFLLIHNCELLCTRINSATYVIKLASLLYSPVNAPIAFHTRLRQFTLAGSLRRFTVFSFFFRHAQEGRQKNKTKKKKLHVDRSCARFVFIRGKRHSRSSCGIESQQNVDGVVGER